MLPPNIEVLALEPLLDWAHKEHPFAFRAGRPPKVNALNQVAVLDLLFDSPFTKRNPRGQLVNVEIFVGHLGATMRNLAAASSGVSRLTS